MNALERLALALAGPRPQHLLPFRNRKRFKQTRLPDRTYYVDLKTLNVGDVVRVRWHDVRRRAVVTSKSWFSHHDNKEVIAVSVGGHIWVVLSTVLEKLS